MKRRVRKTDPLIANSPHLSESGFTLLELILVISILAVMMAMNFRVIQSISESKVVLDDLRDGQFIANSVISRMTRELQLAEMDSQKYSLIGSCDGGVPAAATGGGAPGVAPPREVFVADSHTGNNRVRHDTITFLAREGGQYLPDGGTHTGIVQITYRVAQNPDSKSNNGDENYLLVREELPYRRPVDKACEQMLRFPITNNLVSLEFTFFDHQSKTWEPNWNGPKVARGPALVQFRLKLRSPAGVVQTYTSTVAMEVQ